MATCAQDVPKLLQRVKSDGGGHLTLVRVNLGKSLMLKDKKWEKNVLPGSKHKIRWNDGGKWHYILYFADLIELAILNALLNQFIPLYRNTISI